MINFVRTAVTGSSCLFSPCLVRSHGNKKNTTVQESDGISENTDSLKYQNYIKYI